MARAYMDAPIDQSITPQMEQAIEPMLIDLIEYYGVTEFSLWVQDMVRKVEPVLVKLKKRYPFIKILNIRTHDVSEFDSDDLNDWLEVDSIKGWQEANCQIRMIMYLCSMCHLYKNDAWVRKYEEGGVDKLKDNRGKTKPVEEMTEVEKLKAEMKILEAKNRQLEIENAFIKKLQELKGGGR